MQTVIFWNGKFLSPQETPLLGLNSGLLCGFGLFETMRAYQGNIVYFNQHIARIKNSCNTLKLDSPYDLKKIKGVILRLLKLNSLTDAYVRLSLWKAGAQTDILVVARNHKPVLFSKYRKGFAVGIARLRQDEKNFLAQHKTTNRLIYELNFHEAKKKGFDEAIMLNQRGYICEGTRSNIFFAKKERLFTPALHCGCLDGVTRRVVCDLAAKYGIKLYEGDFKLEDLRAADEVFLTNSLIGVAPVGRVEKRYFLKGTASKLTRFLIQEYKDLL